MIKIELPWIDTALLPNRSNGHKWQVTSAARKQARMYGLLAARAECAIGSINPLRDYSISIVFNPPRNPGPDVDGMLSALKPTLDGIAEALGVNDRRFNPVEITRGSPVAGGAVTVLIDDEPVPFS